jgi:hypothetical protein
MWFSKTAQENNLPIGKNSTNLVTLIGKARFMELHSNELFIRKKLGAFYKKALTPYPGGIRSHNQ